MTLTVIPVIALMALWSFAMVSVTGDMRVLFRLQTVHERFGAPVDLVVSRIQTERRLSAEYAGGVTGPAAMDRLTRHYRATDRAVAAMREAVEDRDGRADLSPSERKSLDAMAVSTDRLAGLRARVIGRALSWDRVSEEYAAVVEPAFRVRTTLTARQTGRLAREAQLVVELVRVREFVSRQDALIAGARAGGPVTGRQYDLLTATIEDRRVFHRTYVPELPRDSRRLFAAFERGPEYRALIAREDALLRAGAGGAGAVAAAIRHAGADRAVQEYLRICTESGINAAGRADDLAHRETVRAAVIGVAGLIAVGLSIWLSAASGRRVSGRLEELRDAADLLATRQLPEVMERLGAGERVDAARAAPPLDLGGDGEHGPDEIAQVGRALNTARLAAVEAAAAQAGLRAGAFAVLRNIARRNQALVHRQSKLVDTLERRTSDPDALEDLFRIDHLTTRMRRHAEGLIILSGAAPGRRRRGPVPLADVVSAAVREIEEYSRVVAEPMPAVGIAADAVADTVHLIAELIENAVFYSPPETRVALRAGPAAQGLVLEIDDRGLGMSGRELARARRTLERPGDFDPAQDDRLGLYVVGRLAERHGIEVTLTPSPHGGTMAVVLLPDQVIAPAERLVPYPGGESGTGGGGALGREERNGGPVRRAPGPPVRSVLPAPGGGPPRRALPVRTRQESPAAPARPGPEGTGREVSADEMRAIFGAFQRGLDRGRRGVDPAGGTAGAVPRPRITDEGTSDDG
ncbi:ATP-binding protein [Streptomyces sp. CAU 1734]|uniref:sensor histidine kinase n=1 Tax=Streptomyces sp. CAU 1734 TaxID=3140360 RepID=UPI0032610E71